MLQLCTASFNLFKMAVQYQFFPILMVQMLFSQNQQVPGSDFRTVGKSLNLSFYNCILHISSFSQTHLFSKFRISILTHCVLGNFCMLFFCHLIFFKIKFFKKLFQEYIQSVKQFESRSFWTSCRPDLCPNCLQRLSADCTSRQRVMVSTSSWSKVFRIILEFRSLRLTFHRKPSSKS